jgi:hypothetical protein
LAGIVLCLTVVVAALGIASRRQPPTLVVTATALVTLALIAAWVAAPERGADLAPLVGTGLGALAAGVANVTGGRPPDPGGGPPPPPTP